MGEERGGERASRYRDSSRDAEGNEGTGENNNYELLASIDE